MDQVLDIGLCLFSKIILLRCVSPFKWNIKDKKSTKQIISDPDVKLGEVQADVLVTVIEVMTSHA